MDAFAKPRRPVGGAGRGGALAAFAAPPANRITVGKGRWASVRQELVDVGIGTGEKSARLDAAQKEILAIGKERWVEKVEETRMIRKMAGLVALGMSLLTVFYAREILWLVRGSVERPGQVKWLAAAGLGWAGATFVVLAVQCARSARGDAMLDHIKETIEAKAKRDRDAARNAV